MKIRIKPAGKLLLLLIFIAIVWGILSLSGILYKSQNENPKIDLSKNKKLIKIGYLNNSIPISIIYSAGDSLGGYGIRDEKANFEMSLKSYENSSNLIELLKDTNSTNIIALNLFDFLSNYEKVKNLKPVIFFTLERDLNEYLFSRNNINQVRNFSAKKVAVTKGGKSHFYLSKLLKDAGLKSNQVDLVFTKNNDESYDRIKNKWVSGFAFDDPKLYTEAIQEKDMINIASKNAIYSSNLIVLITKDSLIKNDPILFKEFLNTVLIADDSIKSNPNIKKDIYEKLSKKNEVFRIQNILARHHLFNIKENSDLFGKSEKSSERVEKTIGDMLDFVNSTSENKMILDSKDIINNEIINLCIAEKSVSNLTDNIKEKKTSVEDLPKNYLIGKKEIVTQESVKKGTSKTGTVRLVKNLESKFDSKNPNRLTIYFEPDGKQLDSFSVTALKDLFKDLNISKGHSFEINGNTDSLGEDKYNWMLSKWRADAVSEYLKNNFNVDKNDIKIISSGSTKPIASNSDQPGRKRNRRVDIFIKSK